MDPSVVVLVIIYEEVGAFLYDGTWNQIGSYAWNPWVCFSVGVVPCACGSIEGTLSP